MKNGAKTLICLMGCVAVAMAAHTATKRVVGGDDTENGDATDNPYGAIHERNIFDLKEPAVVTNAPPPLPPVGVKLTGITTILGKKQGLFMVTIPGAAGKPAKDQSYILNEGQRAGVLELVEIDPKARKARIKNDGIESTLNIETNRVSAGGGTPMGGGGMPGAHAPIGGTPMGGFKPGVPGNQFTPGNPGVTPIPQRPVRPEGGLQPGQQPNYGYQPSGVGVQTPGGTLNLSGMGGTPNPGAVNAPTGQPTMTPEEQEKIIAAQTLMLQNSGNPMSSIMPPTRYTPSPNPNPEAQPVPQPR